MAWRLAIVASALAWMLATLFAAIGKQHKGFLAWLVFMLIVGVLVGGLSALPVLATGASALNGPEGSRIVVAYLLCFAAVGAFACSLLSPLWFFAHHKWLSLNPNSGCPAQTVRGNQPRSTRPDRSPARVVMPAAEPKVTRARAIAPQFAPRGRSSHPGQQECRGQRALVGHERAG